MKTYQYFILFFLILTSCQIKVKEITAPKNLLPKDSLAIVLEELMVIEHHIQSKYPSLQQFHDVAKKSGDRVLKKNNLTFARFDDAMNYYGSHQEDMKKIYDQILERMNRKMNKL